MTQTQAQKVDLTEIARGLFCRNIFLEDEDGGREVKQNPTLAHLWRTEQLFGRLSEKEQTVLSRRFGINSRAQTLEEVGCEFGQTRERIRQIEAQALKKMRRWCEEEPDPDSLTTKRWD